MSLALHLITNLLLFFRLFPLADDVNLFLLDVIVFSRGQPLCHFHLERLTLYSLIFLRHLYYSA